MLSRPDYFDSNYIQSLNIYDRQQKAIHDNEQARINNVNAINAWVAANTTNRTLKLPYTSIPQLVKELIVNDDGTERLQDFAGLPPIALPPENVLVQAGSGFFNSNPNNTPADRTDQIIGMLRAIYEAVKK